MTRYNFLRYLVQSLKREKDLGDSCLDKSRGSSDAQQRLMSLMAEVEECADHLSDKVGTVKI